jgi:hypothetical protein
LLYKIDDRFRLAEEIQLENEDWFVYVNYFGICTKYAELLLASFDRRKVIIDSSQALFSPPLDCLATIYSPRKFLGVPDGGMLVSSLSVNEPSEVDGGSFERSLSLLKRAAFSPEEAYADHQSAEKTLFDQEPRRMSDLTRRILSSVDYEKVLRIRNKNFAYLHTHLGRYNLLPLNPDEVSGALCYPLLTSNTELRNFLISKRIFIPSYWQDVLERVAPSSREAFLVQNLTPLPCDQRYGEDEMVRVVNACRELFTKSPASNGTASALQS